MVTAAGVNVLVVLVLVALPVAVAVAVLGTVAQPVVVAVGVPDDKTRAQLQQRLLADYQVRRDAVVDEQLRSLGRWPRRRADPAGYAAAYDDTHLLVCQVRVIAVPDPDDPRHLRRRLRRRRLATRPAPAPALRPLRHRTADRLRALSGVC